MTEVLFNIDNKEGGSVKVPISYKIYKNGELYRQFVKEDPRFSYLLDEGTYLVEMRPTTKYKADAGTLIASGNWDTFYRTLERDYSDYSEEEISGGTADKIEDTFLNPDELVKIHNQRTGEEIELRLIQEHVMKVSSKLATIGETGNYVENIRKEQEEFEISGYLGDTYENRFIIGHRDASLERLKRFANDNEVLSLKTNISMAKSGVADAYEKNLVIRQLNVKQNYESANTYEVEIGFKKINFVEPEYDTSKAKVVGDYVQTEVPDVPALTIKMPEVKEEEDDDETSFSAKEEWKSWEKENPDLIDLLRSPYAP